MKKPLVVILAGGIGKSFAPLSVNKTLLPICGKPLLQHVIEMAELGGFNKALVITNTENETWLSSYQPFNITIQTSIQDHPAGMAEALLEVEQELGEDPILVINAVDIIDPMFFKQIMRKSMDSYAFVTGLKINKWQPVGYLRIDGNHITEIVEKPTEGQEPSDLMNLVFHYFSNPSEFFPYLKNASSGDDRYERAMNSFMKDKQVDLLRYDGYWMKIKYPYHVLDMMECFLKNRVKKHRSPSAYVSPHAQIEGEVYIDDHAHIDSFAVIKGPAYIGKYAKVGNHALVRQSVIEESAVVGFGSEVARSYVGPSCMLHHNFIGDSILEKSVNPSWGTTTANLRLDGRTVMLKLPEGQKIDSGKVKLGAIIAKDAFLGVNCSLMPGVTIGAGVKVHPGTVVNEAIKSEG